MVPLGAFSFVKVDGLIFLGANSRENHIKQLERE